MTLGVLEAKPSVPALINALKIDESEQPKSVYRAVIDALGLIADPAAVEALITVQFSVADRPGTDSIPEGAIRALAAIGEPAVPTLIEVLEGRNQALNELAAEHGVDVSIVQLSAMRMLGIVGSASAVPAILAAMPNQDCGGGRRVDRRKLVGFDASAAVMTRAFASNALGFIGDSAAVEPLCRCRNASHDPTDLWEITAALGRIGGDEAFRCLEDIVGHNAYDIQAIEPQFEFEIRWEGVRYLILTAQPNQAPAIEQVIAGNKAKVVEEVKQRGYPAGLAVLVDCQQDAACYEKVLLDATRAWFEREVAAFNFARLATPGDIVAAAKLARAFKTRDPDARVHIAWLTAKVAAGRPCPDCVDALEQVMKSEETTKDARMQAAWIMARQTIAKL
jgi:HEAT repeat protein